MQPDFLAVAQTDGKHSLARELKTRRSTDEADQAVADAPRSQILQSIRASLGERNFRHWFADRTTLSLEGSTLRVGVGGSFLLNWMQKQFAALLQSTLREMIPDAQVVWYVDEESGELPLQGDGEESDDLLQQDRVEIPSTPKVEKSGRENLDSSVRITGRTTASSKRAADSCSPDIKVDEKSAGGHDARRFRDLARFVAGAGSELALTAARQVSQQPGERYSPLFLHGGVGTGKTHLAEGIYREIRRLHSSLRVVFMTSEQFTNQFTSALRSHTLPAFRQRFRSVDVLIVDDIGFLGGKRVIQEEFLHTFKQLESHGRQLVVTCDTHPRLMTGASEELVSRLLCGLVCRLESPDVETRRKIVESLAISLETPFDASALDYIARRFVTSVRELEGAVNTLQTWHTMTGRRVTQTVARQVLADLERDCVKVVNLAAIEAMVSELFALQKSDLKSSRRTKAVTQPRMLAMFLARRHTQSAYKEIGEFFGGRNHSTVIAAEKKVAAWVESNEELQIGGRSWKASDLVETLEQQLLAG